MEGRCRRKVEEMVSRENMVIEGLRDSEAEREIYLVDTD